MVSHAHRLAFSRAHAVEWVGHGVWARPVYAGAHGLATKHQERLDGVVLCRLEEAFHILSRARAGKRVRRKRRASQHCTIHTLLSTASVPQFKRGSTPEEAAQEREHTKGGNSRERAHQRRQFKRGSTPKEAIQERENAGGALYLHAREMAAATARQGGRRLTKSMASSPNGSAIAHAISCRPIMMAHAVE